MKIIISPDSFKQNITSPEVCSLIEEGILRADKNATIFKIPLADGGEGTARAITLAAGGRFIKTNVTDPLGKKINAEFGLIENDNVAVLDIASACGIELLDKNELNPMKASSYGAGELIAAALDTGAKELIIGIGGSAVNDGGIGLINALGFKVLDKDGKPVGHGGGALSKIASIDCSGAVFTTKFPALPTKFPADKRFSNVSIKAACDVTNPLLGANGASAVFGPQKGATAEMVKALDDGLFNLAKAWQKAGLIDEADYSGDVTGAGGAEYPADSVACYGVEHPGDGAAGGIGAALRICLGASFESGAMLVMKYAGFFKHLPDADLVITGEGMTDAQTSSGKLCSIAAREARNAGVPVALISGALSGDRTNLLSVFDYAVSIACGQIGLDAMLKDSRQDLIFAAENLIRAINIGTKKK